MKVLLTGGKGMLGRTICHELTDFEVIPTDLPEADITDEEAIDAVVRDNHPDAVIHCAAMTAVDKCEEAVDLAYRSDLDDCGLEELFAREREKERVLRYTTAGIQRDDLSFRLDGHPLRRCGSQGQQKSFLLAMKLAQFRFVQRIYGQTPILLLDDVFDKLDMQRVEDLLALVSTLDFGQIFLTDSNKVRLENVSRSIGAPCRSFRVEKGQITEETEE